MTENPHYVTVTPGTFDEDADWRDEATVKFECRGDQDSECHKYPDCDCEYWDDNHEHPRVKHDECWMQGWFESEAGHSYVGADFDDRDDNGVPRDMDRSGPIKTTYDIDGFVEWQFES